MTFHVGERGGHDVLDDLLLVRHATTDVVDGSTCREDFLVLFLPLADELGLKLARNIGQHRTLKEISKRLIELSAAGKKVVLCIDEAQAMPAETLEALRLLTNLETEKRKLLQVVLFGQPELDEYLAKPSARQLRQRITFSYQLQPIDYDGVHAYVSHRLLVAGSAGAIQFQPKAVNALYRASRGIPRLINILSHKALMVCYGQGKKSVTGEHVKAAADDTEDVRSRNGEDKRKLWIMVIGFSLISMLALTAWLLMGSNA